MKTHPSSENPNAAPDKSHPAMEEIQNITEILSGSEYTDGQAVLIYANQSL